MPAELDTTQTHVYAAKVIAEILQCNPEDLWIPPAKAAPPPSETQLIKQGICKQGSEFEDALFHRFLPPLEKDVYINTFQAKRDNS